MSSSSRTTASSGGSSSAAAAPRSIRRGRRVLRRVRRTGPRDHCACPISEGVRELGIEIRAGLHTGECERIDQKVGAIAVNIGARVASEAGPSEVLVSSTVKDLVAGSGIAFRERGVAELKGVPGEWRLFAVESTTP